MTDLRAVVALAKKCGAIVACDNTWATPLFQLPLKIGVDVVMHSVTKYLSGHSDVTMGALIFKDNGRENGGKENGPLLEKITSIQHEGGAVPSPFECWLTLRGLQTFPYRVRAHSENSHRIAEFLIEFRDPDTKLPLPSFDLWEERQGVFTFTACAVVAGLSGALAPAFRAIPSRGLHPGGSASSGSESRAFCAAALDWL